MITNLPVQELFVIFKRIPTYSKIVYELYRSRQITNTKKLMLTAALAYIISPIDLVPGFVPIAGQLDDVIVVLTVLRRVIRSSPPSVITPIIQKHGIDLDTIDHDLTVCKKSAKILTRMAGRTLAKTSFLTGKALYKTGKHLLKAFRQRRLSHL